MAKVKEACKLYEGKTVSLGKAAELAGMGIEALMEELGKRGVPVIDHQVGELDRDLGQLK